MFDGHWYAVTKFDPRAVDLFSRHYSSKINGKMVKDWLKFGIASPGETMTLINTNGTALFVWLKQKYNSGDQFGVNCAVFRNESKTLSSTLIIEAEHLAWGKWPGERLFTYVDATKIKSVNPGYCFLRAGWRRCGVTKNRGLIILEKLPEAGS